MTLAEIFAPIIGQPEGQNLEYKATLVPARAIAQIIAGLANADGGYLIFGVRDLPKNRVDITGLSEDFKVGPIFSKAEKMLEPLPILVSGSFLHSGKQLFGVQISKSAVPIFVEGRKYIRYEGRTTDSEAPAFHAHEPKFSEFTVLQNQLMQERNDATSPKKRFVDHYLSVLRLYEPLLSVLFPSLITAPIATPEGRTINRLLYSSCMDNFETYLSELLYEIYLAQPNALKARDATVKVEDVLNCSDIDDFIQKLAAKRVGKLQKGSIRGFLKDNAEIKGLDALSENDVTEVEKALQIRHLYSHRNGLVDDTFIEYFGDLYPRNTEHQLSLSETIKKMEFMVRMVAIIDRKAAIKYSLSINDPT